MAEPRSPYDVLIIGQGAAGFSVALYAARYQMKSVIFGEKFGGETAIGGMIENYPGYSAIDGFELMVKMKEQVEKYNVDVVDEGVEVLSRGEDCLHQYGVTGFLMGQQIQILATDRCFLYQNYRNPVTQN